MQRHHVRICWINPVFAVVSIAVVSIVRSMMGIQKGFGIYFMNSTLAINLFSLNDNETFCSQLLSYVGRFNYSDVECLFAICTAIDTHNTSVARMEVLILYLLKALQSCQIHASNKVVWQ